MNAHLYRLQSLFRATNVFKRAFVGHSLSLTLYSSPENLKSFLFLKIFIQQLNSKLLRLVTYKNH